MLEIKTKKAGAELTSIKLNGEEKLHHHALLVVVDWTTEVKAIHSQGRHPSHQGRNW